MSFSPEAFCMAKVSGGGGNPNRTETIFATADYPFGDMTTLEFTEFSQALYDKNASAVLDVDATVLGAGHVFGHLYVLAVGQINMDGAAIGIYGDGSAYSAYWYHSMEMHHSLYMVAFEEGSSTFTDASEYMSMIPSTLTIYWHPMPT